MDGKPRTDSYSLQTNAAGYPRPLGLYDPANEHDGCGVGFVVRLDAKPTHEVVEDGVRILVNLEHRGAVGGDKLTGDGAGLLTQIPDDFFRRKLKAKGYTLPAPGDYAVGMIFLPVDKRVAKTCRSNLVRVAEQEGAKLVCWRDVPISAKHLGALSLQSKPRIMQVVLERHQIAAEDFERKLFVIRRLAEKAFGDWCDDDTSQFYIASLSSRTIVYKGLFTGTQLIAFYPDLTDPRFISPYALVHQRYSTNTLPTWALAQPLRYVAHNGEINALRGNINQMRARESGLSSPVLGDDLDRIKPILIPGASDSAIFDNALELLVQAGRSLPHAMMMMVPEAWGSRYVMSADKRAFYEYHSAFMEPWDGPAALMFCDGRYIGATLDRNGLRPARYTITKDGLIVMASESGVLDIAPERIQARGNLAPGRMFLVDLEQKRVIPDHEIKAKVSRGRQYRQWLKSNTVELSGLFQPASAPIVSEDNLLRLHHAFGYTAEELRMVLAPMAAMAQEPVGSMGNDTALPIFSDRPQLLFAYFKQLFAQVTNPAIDPLREELVMSLMGWVGEDSNLLDESRAKSRRLKLNHPILSSADLYLLRSAGLPDFKTADIDILFDATDGVDALAPAVERMCAQAEQAIEGGARLLVLTDWRMDARRAAIPVLLAAAGLHHHLIRRGLRNRVGLIVETGEAREVAHFALLIGYGVNAICPYGALATVSSLASNGRLDDEDIDADRAVDHYITAVKKGLLKTLSRMGISTLRSYLGAQIFEAIGLAPALVNAYFTGTPSRIGGIGAAEVAREALERHRLAYPKHGAPSRLLDTGGTYHFRVGGAKHLWTPESIYKLQHAVRTNDYAAFKEYAALIDDQSAQRSTLRSLFRFRKGNRVPLDKVESAASIVKRFASAAMSYGSISKEAHETVAIAMNRLGAKSNSGEGGEDEARYTPLPNGDSRRSAIKQVASGRFGVTTSFLINADEIQIKIAQGAKPGEGGQLPGHKVTAEIAKVRHTTKGVTLISPPPHHDIYSIEDLAQLIHDLKTVNPNARVSVKLVSEVGVGTIAAGVAKASTDMVLIAGHDGGTGASPLTSIMNTGAPWELGLAETQQSLILSGLRGRIRVQTDGQLKTGRDLAVAALLGAEEFGFGTTLLVSLGCIMMRKCHTDTCPVGVATQDEGLRKLFSGKPEHVERFCLFIAEQLREYMAQLGFRTVDAMVGRVDMLEMEPGIEHWKTRGVDLSPILMSVKNGSTPRRCMTTASRTVEAPLDDELVRLAEPALNDKTPVVIDLPVRNVHRTVGARLGGQIVRRYGPEGLPDDTIDITLTGSVGQSAGAFLVPGMALRIVGDANDYAGKGMSGGRLVIAPHPEATFPPQENAIVGNTVLYGATGGESYVNGIAGMRFAVRNSGATAVVEGVGDHGCEYMTGGIVVVLGATGYNFAAGMSGGIAYVYDPTQLFDTRCNLDMVELESVWKKRDERELRRLIENHLRFTGSPRAREMLENWEAHLPLFVKVVPLDYKKVLERLRSEEPFEADVVSASEEVFRD